MSFEPELGQMFFTNTSWQEMNLNKRLMPIIRSIGTALVTYGLTKNDPCDNMGEEYENDTFSIGSYCWCDGKRDGHGDGCPPNFQYKDVTVCWYKYIGRGSSQNREVSDNEMLTILEDCMESIKNDALNEKEE